MNLELFNDVILFIFICDLFIDAVIVPCYKPGLCDVNTLGGPLWEVKGFYVPMYAGGFRSIFLEVIVAVIVK